MKEVVVGADQSRMDLSLLDLVTVIVPLLLMALGAPPHQLDVWILTPPDNIFMLLVGCQRDRLVPLS